VAERGGDTAFDFTEAPGNSGSAEITPRQSGLAPVFPLAAALHVKLPFAAASRKNEVRPPQARPSDLTIKRFNLSAAGSLANLLRRSERQR
jgi:hypothetical protein